MKKNIIWLIILLLLIGGVVYYKQYYPLSQWQLNNSFSSASVQPTERYFNATDIDCGIWYEKGERESLVSGKDNEMVKSCFQKKFTGCVSGKILLIDDKSEIDDTITYSLVRIIKGNDRDACIIQNEYQQENTTDTESQPIYFVNTCTSLAEDLVSSCEPQYIKEKKEKMKEIPVETQE
ncbi:hypothetical protein HOB30_04510 [Candidatus Falkowbacteria bacterium]|jgi:hypothetical protein|nr:hypothetical protein [Candidatus Falkowbacteria bacterium]